MKKQTLLIFSCVLALVVLGCDKDETSSFTSEDETLAGETVTAGDKDARYVKLFVLNEGSYGQNNSTLDFFRYSDGKYVRNSFSQMNPTISAGLGDVGNDIAIRGDEAWIVVNNSGLVEIVSARDEKHIATLEVPTPRNIVLDNEYAYVTSWAGAYYGGDARKGAVYRIGLSNKTVKDTVNVGYQPEGITLSGGNLYVANSGGVNPGGYENTISIISQAEFKVTGSISLPSQKNLKDVVASGGDLWVSSLGDYYSVHSGLARINLATKQVNEYDDVRVGTRLWNDAANDKIYVIGTQDEWVWTPGAKKTYSIFVANTVSGDISEHSLPDGITYPYSIAVDGVSGDIFIGDAADSKTPGSIMCYDATYSLKWKATAGLFPGHFAFFDAKR